MDEGCDIVRAAASITLAHHQRQYRTGYPNGLCGDRILIEERLVAPCGARSDKSAREAGAALGEMGAQSGRQVDPACVTAFERGRSRNAAQAEPHAPRVSAE